MFVAHGGIAMIHLQFDCWSSFWRHRKCLLLTWVYAYNMLVGVRLIFEEKMYIGTCSHWLGQEILSHH